MKKFLSLALALIMTLSLVTISAGATEYKDLTDKDEIQYEEAVAVLNRLGIITGYSEGDFRPQGELTRGAAAKIIVSLLIGAEAAEALPVTGNPYPDVPAGNTFAGVISYCKNMKIIDGYSDGTFRPTGTLTGYAFSKMLLSALGYDGKQEGGFTGPGWTTNVAALGHEANLFDRISFNGGETVNRETACQLALNTLKATMVEYTGGMDVVVGDTQINAPKTRTFKTSNQEWASHIDSRRAGYQWTAHGSQTTNVNDSHYTVEFGEEKFKDLRMDHDRNTHDDFGRPANVWSYKKVTIGTFAIEPDFVYTTQVAHNVATTTDAAKVRALELNGYDLTADTATVNGQTYTNLWLNGKWLSADSKSSDGTLITNEKDIKEGDSDNYLTKVADIADYTDNGTLVEVYVDDADADFIRDVVVIKTQLMEVRSQKSESVALKLYDDASDADGKIIYGYNQKPIDKAVNDVEINDDLYATLKDKKVGDIIAVVPVYVDSETKYDVADAYIPETVSGTLTRVDTYGNVTANVKNDGYLEENGRGVISATVGGTEYKVALWNKDLYDIDGTTIRVTRKDVTLYMDAYGNAMLAKDVGATSNFMVVSGYHSGLVNGRVVTFVDGYDINGNEISLNIGNHNYVEGSDALFPRGNLVHYKSNTSSNYAEWDLDYLGVFDVASLRGDEAAGTEPYSLKASNGRVMLNGWMTGKGTAAESYKGNDNKDNTAWTQWKESDVTKNIPTDDAGVKFIYVTIGDDGEVDSVEIKNGMQAATNEEIRGTGSKFVHARAQACVSLKESNTVVNDDSVVKAVVIKQDSSSANLNNLVYIHNYAGSAGRSTDNQGRIVYGYEVKFIGASDWDDTKTIYSYKNLSIGDFARARKATEAPTEVQGVTEDNFYTLNGYDERTGVALSVSTSSDARIEKIIDNNKTLLRVDDYYDQANAKIHGVWTSDKDLDLGDELANDIVSIAHAKIIDLTGNDVENATDLKDLWNDVTDAQKAEGLKRNIKISMLYNDKDSDDEFRDVYVLVIRNASGTYKPDSKPVVETGDLTASLAGVTLTGDVKNLKKGDVVTITLAAGYEYDASANKGITVVVNEDGTLKVTIDSFPAVLGVKETVIPADSHKITVTVDGVEDATLSKTVKNGEAAEIIYTVPAGKTATYKIGDAAEVAVPADGKITVPAGDADVTVAIVTKDEVVVPGELNIVICNSAKDAAATAAIKAGITKSEDGTTINVTGIPADTERYKVTVGDNSIQANGSLAYTDGATIYIQYGSVKGVLGEDGVITTEIVFPTIAADTEGAPLSAQSIQNAPKYNWVGTNEFIYMTLKGEDVLMEIMRDEEANKTGYKPQPSKAQFVVDAFNEAGDAGIDLEIKPADAGFGVVNGIEVGITATEGEGDFTAAEAVKIETIGNNSEKYATAKAGYDLYVNGEKVEGTVQLKAGDVVSVVKGGESGPVDNTVRAVYDSTNHNWKLYAYKKNEVTDTDAKAALGLAIKKTVTKIDGDTITLADGNTAALEVDTSPDSGSMKAPMPLYKVTILGNTEYMYAGEEFEVPSTVKALILEGEKAVKASGAAAKFIKPASSSDPFALNSTIASLDAVADDDESLVYVEALEIINPLTAFAGYTPWFQKDGEWTEFTANSNTEDWIEKGLEIRVTGDKKLVGETVSFMVNGKVVATSEVDEKGHVDSGLIPLTEVVPNPAPVGSGLTPDKVNFGALSGITLTLDGEPVENGKVFKAGDAIVISIDSDKTLGWKNKLGVAAEVTSELTTDPTPDGMTYKLAPDGVTAAVSNSKTKGVLELVTGYKVTLDTATNGNKIVAYKTLSEAKDPTGTSATAVAGTDFFEAGKSIFIKVEDATSAGKAKLNSWLAAEDGSDAPTPVATDAAPSWKAAGVWEIKPTANIDLGEYEVVAQLPASPFASATQTAGCKVCVSGQSQEATITVANALIPNYNGETVTAAWDDDTLSGMTVDELKLAKGADTTAGYVTITIDEAKFTPGAGGAAGSFTCKITADDTGIDGTAEKGVVVFSVTVDGVTYTTKNEVAFAKS